MIDVKNNNVFSALKVSAGSSILIFLAVWIVSWIVGSLVVVNLSGAYATRWATLVQDCLMFVAPAFATLYFISCEPIKFSRLDGRTTFKQVILTSLIVIASIPLLNRVVAANESIKFPDRLSGLEATLRRLEELAAQMIDTIMGEPTWISLIVCVLLIGVLTGFAEEIFFRGTLQPIFKAIFRNGHIAVWVTAFVFSTMHMQFFGFIPRLLMGAFLGYLVWWSGSLWLSVIAHALNNSLVVVSMWLNLRNPGGIDLFKTGEGTSILDLISALISIAAVVMLIRKLYGITLRRVVH